MVLLLDDALETRVLSHYYLVAETIAKHFAGEPIVFANFPAGFDKPPHWHRTQVPLSANKLLWLCHRMFAVEFHGWAPLPNQLDRLRFARILLEHSPDAARRNLGAATLRDMLAEYKLQAAPIFDGNEGIALWIPFADAPAAETVRPWLHALCNDAVARRPDLFTTEPNTHDVKRVHLHVASNAAWHFSVLPYSLRGAPGFPVATPFRWEELDTLNGALNADAFVHRWKNHGDVFGDVLAAIPPQTFASLAAPRPAPEMIAQPRGTAITAAFDILEDGKARTAQQILDEALARGLVQRNMTKKYVYTALIEYIARTIGHARKPLIVQNQDRTFRINQPPDDWPDLAPPAQPVIDANTQALIDRLETTSTGTDPAAFEIAVCDAFAHLGFAATHVGGHGAPDGYADAQLGVLGYRVMLECKTAKGVVTQPDCVEASKYNAAYNAQCGAIVGPEFPEEEELVTELHTHGVTALTVSDLRTLLCLGATPLELRQILKPGFACDFLSDLLWERTHGERKRIAVVADLIRREGWNAQVTAAQQGGPANAPLLTVDSAMLLVDAALRAAGSVQACTRDQVQAAFSHLTDPLVGHAVWTDPTRGAIVILRSG